MPRAKSSEQITQDNTGMSENTEAIKLCAGFIPGNGYSKLIVSDNSKTLVRSEFYQLTQGLSDEDYSHTTKGAKLQFLECPSGSKGLELTNWLTGELALEERGSKGKAIVNAPQLKIDYSPLSFFSALALAGIEGETLDVTVCCSLLQAKNFAPDLREKLEGQWVIAFNNGKPKTIQVNVAKVFDEGKGASFFYDKFQTLLVYDCGHGTLIGSIFYNGRLKDNQVILEGFGVKGLIDRILSSDEMKSKRLSDFDLVMQGILNQSLTYGAKKTDFSTVYKQALKIWIDEGIEVMRGDLSINLDKVKKQVLIGGGSKLPYISETLVKLGIENSEDGQWIDCKGLYELAKLV